MITPSLNARLAQLQALAEYMDRGSNFATFVFYSDTKPSSLNTPPDNNAKLVTLTLPKPSFKKMNLDSVELHQSDAGIVTSAGVATWARLFNGEGVAVADFEVGTDIVLANPDLVLGSTLMMNSIKFRPSE